ncbi:MAG: BrnT family toxin [Candidatus Ozemobacteraceae bacterium]
MKIKTCVWLPQYVEKLAAKHQVEPLEVEEMFKNRHKDFFWETGDHPGEDFYSSLGQTNEGRYLRVFFILKKSGDALIISARDMDSKERKRYAKK